MVETECESIKIKNIIAAVAEREDRDLFPFKKGIFFLPEHAFSYLVGKEIVRHSMEIFGCEVKSWKTECNDPGSGRSDLVLEFESRNSIVFEFKSRYLPYTKRGYIKDIQNLSDIDSSKYTRYFCALLDCIDDSMVCRNISEIENILPDTLNSIIEPDNNFYSFKTLDHSNLYKDKEIICVIGLWEICDEPRIEYK